MKLGRVPAVGRRYVAATLSWLFLREVRERAVDQDRTGIAGLRFYVGEYRQSVDHSRCGLGTFMADIFSRAARRCETAVWLSSPPGAGHHRWTSWGHRAIATFLAKFFSFWGWEQWAGC